MAVSLRLATIGARFVAIYIFARYLSVHAFGQYGLLAATIAFCVYAVGFDFYSYSTRQIIVSDRERWPMFLKSHANFSLLTYGVVLPVVSVMFLVGWLPIQLYVWFLLLLPLEHSCLEADRVLVAMGHQQAASLAAFIRQGLLLLALAPLLWLDPGSRSLATVLLAWIAFDAASLVFSVAVIRRVSTWGSARVTVDWSWVRSGVRTSSVFLIGTLCLRALFTADRQLVSLWSSAGVLGAYTLFMSLAAGISSVIASGIHQFLYPSLVASASRHDRPAFYRGLWALTWQTLATLIVLSAGLAVASHQVLLAIGKDEYLALAWMLPWVLVAVGLFNISLIPHYGMYALHLDRHIMTVTAVSTAAFFVSAFALSELGAVTAVLSGISIGCSILLVGKSLILYRNLHLLDAPQA
ncbi:lipopolysaccharide biosynthesis protein [Nocardioides sp.]|uniref:lipopolysaccharide biosynthesis protein n=1 Tax=Nocardioides sp. TaxID=35761 RepID=UPI0037845E8F